MQAQETSACWQEKTFSTHSYFENHKNIILFSACSIFPKNHTETAKKQNSVTTISCTNLETKRK